LDNFVAINICIKYGADINIFYYNNFFFNKLISISEQILFNGQIERALYGFCNHLVAAVLGSSLGYLHYLVVVSILYI
jgi:hypothetical protein